ncbi:TPA: baseplate J/gp47 family protein [Pseudomonas aeruginosa]
MWTGGRPLLLLPSRPAQRRTGSLAVSAWSVHRWESTPPHPSQPQQQGGGDQESVQSLLARLLEIMRQPPAGGASYDYERWAKEVDGVADALILPGRRGGGTVDVVITGTTGVPSAEVIADCLSHIQDVCSVIADVWVYAPTIRVVDALVQIDLASGYTLAEVQQAASDAYTSLLGTLKPTDQLKRSQLEAMVSNLPGVADRVLVTPASNVDASTDPTQVGWIRPGAITVEAMP